MDERDKLVEAVARAMCCRNGECQREPGRQQSADLTPMPCNAICWLSEARAALSAVLKDFAIVPRKPDWSMVNAGAIAALESRMQQRKKAAHRGEAEQVEASYRAMICKSPIQDAD